MKDRIVKSVAAILFTLLVTGSALMFWEPHMEVCAAENAAKTLKLAMTEGTVTVTDSIGKKLPTFEQMSLKNGQHVKTDEASYAWINMDDSKTAKLGQATDVDISQQNEDLEIRLNAGDLLVHVTKKIARSATVKIRSGSIVTGITGTDPQIRLAEDGTLVVTFLTGKGQMAVTNAVTGQMQNFPIGAGQTAEIDSMRAADGGLGISVSIRQTTSADLTDTTLDDIIRKPDLRKAVVNNITILNLSDVDLSKLEEKYKKKQAKIKESKDQLFSLLNSDIRTINTTNEKTKEAERKAREEAEKEAKRSSHHSSDDDDDNGSSQQSHTHTWGHDVACIRNAPDTSPNVWFSALLMSDPVSCTVCGETDTATHTVSLTKSPDPEQQDNEFRWECSCGATGTGTYTP